MNKEQKEHIKKNLVAIIEETGNVETLFVLLYSSGLLSENELQITRAIPDNLTRLFDVYTKVQRKDSYYQLISILEGSENAGVANILKSIEGYSKQDQETNIEEKTNDDFLISSDGVTEILSVLGQYPSLKDFWELICQQILPESSIANLGEYNVFAVKILKTLQMYRTHRVENAKFNFLQQAIAKWNEQAGRALLDNKRRIQEKN